MKRKILIVDDETDIVQLLTDMLTEDGYCVFSAKNVREFKECAFAEKPDLIILDIMLGQDNGAQAYSALVAEGFDRNVPVIFLSALAEGHTAKAATGRTYALHTKPFQYDSLLQDINCLTRAA